MFTFLLQFFLEDTAEGTSRNLLTMVIKREGAELTCSQRLDVALRQHWFGMQERRFLALIVGLRQKSGWLARVNGTQLRVNKLLFFISTS